MSAFLDEVTDLKANEVATTSRMRAWWLSTIRHHSVETVHSVPRQGLLGGIKYTNTWILSREEGVRKQKDGR